MSKGREPAYFCLDTRAARIVRRLSDAERLTFFDIVLETYLKLLDGETDFSFPDDLLGDVLRQATDTLIDGFGVYLQRATARVGKGKDHRNTSDVSVEDQRSIIDHKSDQSSSDHDSSGLQIIKDQLVSEGFRSDEVDIALQHCQGRTVTDLAAYLRKTIQNMRKRPIVLPSSAHNFQERDYADVPDQMMADLTAEIEAARAAKII